jgi:predicted MFS family arabinose efflux permease
MVAHCAGMVDLVALPLWIGVLVSHYRFDPQQAGLLATLFLAGAVAASILVARRFNSLPTRAVAVCGYGVAALAFVLAATQSDFATLAALHSLAGLSTGAALSVAHGTIARSDGPHRLFALVGIALGFFAIVFLGATPAVIAGAGGPGLFFVFAGVMGAAALVAAVAFPQVDDMTVLVARLGSPSRMPTVVWFGIAGIAGMSLVQAMTFSFLERVGVHRGFGASAITGVLVAASIVALFPAALAALLERRWQARSVLVAGPVLQALLVVLIMNSTSFDPYAVAGSVIAAVMIFTHTFAFGLLARLEPTGQAMAATPAMTMIGSAMGPVLGGTLVKAAGYGMLSVAAIVICSVAFLCMLRLPGGRASSQPVAVA